MATSVEFEFAIGDKVRITLNGLHAQVREVWKDDDGIRKYNCRYVCRNERVTDRWFKASEIKLLATEDG